MTIQTAKQLANLSISQRRIEILVGAKLKKIDSINSAVKIQDSIRSKIGKWCGSKEIKRWREAN